MDDRDNDLVGVLSHVKGALARCSECSELNEIHLAEAVARWIIEPALICEHCGQPLDLLRSLSTVVGERVELVPLSIAGATTTVWQRPLSPMFFVHLRAVGVPAGARLLRVEWHTDERSRSPELPEFSGSVFVTGQRQLPAPLRPEGETLSFAVHTWKEQNFDGVNVELFLTWAPPDVAQEADEVLQSFEAFTAARTAEAIVHANTAVEIVVNRLVRNTVDRYASGRARGAYQDARIDYADKLDYLLPALAALQHVPPMPETVTGRLRRLRKLRNEVSHGKSLEPAVRKEIPDLLVSALLAVEYVRLVERAANDSV